MLEGHDLANLLFCAHTLWLNYITVTFLLVSSSPGTNYDQLCLCRVMAKKAPEQKHRTKNFAKLPNHLPILTCSIHFPVLSLLIAVHFPPSTGLLHLLWTANNWSQFSACRSHYGSNICGGPLAAGHCLRV